MILLERPRQDTTMRLAIVLLAAASAIAQAEASAVCPLFLSKTLCLEEQKDECGEECPPQKCCSNGCGHVCMAADYACPEPSAGSEAGICVEQCSSVSDCRLKCCDTGCAKSCVRPVCDATPCAIRCQYGLETDQYGCQLCRCKENPCQTVRCAKGEVCEVVNVQCIQAPCPPVAQCVKACEEVPCKSSCPYDFLKDENGCDIDPCKGTECEPTEECRLTPVVCVTAPCPPVAECVPIANPCKQPLSPGPCDGAFPRWHYDADADVCKKFVYGGCQGNKNNFPSEAHCNFQCLPPKWECPADIQSQLQCFPGESREECSDDKPCPQMECCHNGCANVCALPGDHVCQSRRRRLLCHHVDECDDHRPCPQQICCKTGCGSLCTSEDPCRHPKFPGPCKASFLRWYYDKQSGKCRQFTYGGCGANGNNFETKLECQKQCGMFYQKPDVRDCGVEEIQFFYNPDTCECEKFTYGGCDGNDNHFVTEDACKQKCGNEKCAVPVPVG